MKTALLALIMIAGFSTASADETYPGGCAGQIIGSCTEVDGNGNTVGPNYITCTAKDSYGNKYKYTGSYQKPTSTNVGGAIKICQAHSADPESCKWAVCVWAD